ncbi:MULTISPECIES: aminoglycoside phosphotransferase family protein [Rhizobium/Agrobacterium group]|uniref:aminoglycoside phosphotransferase family protein n=1 Tax=Rhizobium/Agrobacterium group TaxID=227290 RepID=UPI000B4002C8|nr:MULTISPECIES: aminoglycoside phosphotransferase family protein [Rhizobium/Agrobacterium group]MCF1473779.1 aminoglycoside phosphotransferase family protein [Allorhizobium ampelinum]MCF1484363.1 aminoglycoside phosphotransferase family protein [Allorhizobium ampelinum]NSZ44004.1 aminoglycoside phosphotransferase family protein [Agrobacterium vitis]NTA27752.1 aminoglycoside phosphotransferase family protein [Allorhizobium ampelinum]OVE93822.1 aminoglycoside phosphotransferase [Allorhizobium a
MHSDQININAAHVRDLIADQFPQFRGEEIIELETAGTANAIFRIGAKHAARFPLRMMDPAECSRLLEAEARASAEFNECCLFPSPKPVGIGRQSSDYPLPWYVQTWIEGQIATPTGLCNSPVFALDLVRLIITLRTANLNGRTFEGRGRGGNLTDHDGWMEVCFSKSEHLLDVDHLRSMWRSLRELPSPNREVMSHKDIIPTNLLVNGEHLVGVLDTGGFAPADPSLDLVAGWHLLDRDTRAAFREGLQVDDLEWHRGAAWAFQQAMGLVWYYKDTNPIMADLGRSTISRLIEDYPSQV